jgi:hypothetical protein
MLTANSALLPVLRGRIKGLKGTVQRIGIKIEANANLYVVGIVTY